MRTKTVLLTIVLLLTMGMMLAACGSKSETKATQPSGSTSAPAVSDGATLVQDRCTKCHTLERVTSAKKNADQWTQTVNRMISNGAQLTDQEKQVVIDYLAKTYGP